MKNKKVLVKIGAFTKTRGEGISSPGEGEDGVHIASFLHCFGRYFLTS